MSFQIVYQDKVVTQDIPNLPKVWKGKIKKAIEEKLTVSPDVYGKPLRRSLRGYRRLRVGDYRVVFRVEEAVVKILVIQHRSRVYEISEKRM